MKTAVVYFLIAIFSATLLQPDELNKNQFIIWNIGQGQWTTWVHDEACDHFDIGGETHLWRHISRLCHGRIQRVHLSHWDWDHMSELGDLRQSGEPVCLWNWPLGTPSPHKLWLAQGLPFCKSNCRPYRVVYHGDDPSVSTSNETSEVVTIPGVLIPGDSPVSSERKWAAFGKKNPIQILVLGHHGSRTSTSDFLLSHLPSLQMAVASARQARYGHPHTEVLQRLQKHKTPVLRTEDWGSIGFSMNENPIVCKDDIPFPDHEPQARNIRNHHTH